MVKGHMSVSGQEVRPKVNDQGPDFKGLTQSYLCIRKSTLLMLCGINSGILSLKTRKQWSQNGTGKK